MVVAAYAPVTAPPVGPCLADVVSIVYEVTGAGGAHRRIRERAPRPYRSRALFGLM